MAAGEGRETRCGARSPACSSARGGGSPAPALPPRAGHSARTRPPPTHTPRQDSAPPPAGPPTWPGAGPRARPRCAAPPTGPRAPCAAPRLLSRFRESRRSRCHGVVMATGRRWLLGREADDAMKVRQGLAGALEVPGRVSSLAAGPGPQWPPTSEQGPARSRPGLDARVAGAAVPGFARREGSHRAPASGPERGNLPNPGLATWLVGSPSSGAAWGRLQPLRCGRSPCSPGPTQRLRSRLGRWAAHGPGHVQKEGAPARSAGGLGPQCPCASRFPPFLPSHLRFYPRPALGLGGH